MATSYGALCTDFYINQKLALKMDLPSDRETILHFFDLVRREMPSMHRFRRYDGRNQPGDRGRRRQTRGHR